jgi:hypothetical protein
MTGPLRFLVSPFQFKKGGGVRRGDEMLKPIPESIFHKPETKN